MKNILKSLTPAAFLLVALAGCKKDYLETVPSDAVTEADAFGSTDIIVPVLDGSYRKMFAFSVGHDNFGQKSVDLANDLMGQDMIVNTQGYGWFNRDYQYAEWILPTPTNRRSDMVWLYYYDLIKQMNIIVNSVDAAKGETALKESIKGQALAVRANSYFYLINMYQQTYKGHETSPGVPLYTSSAIAGAARGTVQEVYDQIVKDLTEAETLLTGKPRTSKMNIDITVVQGIRARVALVMEDWPTAASKAAAARSGYTLMNTAQYGATGAFSTLSNPEWMWGAQIPTDQATIYASYFSHMDVRTGGYAALGGQKKITKALYDQIDAADGRKSRWTAPGAGTGNNVDYNQVKFQVPVAGSWAADYLYMRASEMYLIEAEANAKIGAGNEAAARTALETVIKARFPAYTAGTLSGAALLNEIYLQRRIELWGEGWSLMDIKRRGLGVNRPTGPGNHGSPNFDPIVYTTEPNDPRFLMRIPQREIDNNAAMTPGDQNP